MGLFLSLISLASFAFLFKCTRTDPSETRGETPGYAKLLGVKSLQAYEKTLNVTIGRSCTSCHGYRQGPLFASPDLETAHEFILDRRFVYLNSPEKSRLVTKIREGHIGIPRTVADEMEQGIAAWAALILPEKEEPYVSPFTPQASVTSGFRPKCLNCAPMAKAVPGVVAVDYQKRTLATQTVQKRKASVRPGATSTRVSKKVPLARAKKRR